MTANRHDAALEVFSTCPPFRAAIRRPTCGRSIDVARWSEEHGCKGILVYSDNSQLDAWLLSQVIIQHTTALCPLVAVQPIYMHPYTVAKTMASIGASLRPPGLPEHGRRRLQERPDRARTTRRRTTSGTSGSSSTPRSSSSCSRAGAGDLRRRVLPGRQAEADAAARARSLPRHLRLGLVRRRAGRRADASARPRSSIRSRPARKSRARGRRSTAASASASSPAATKREAWDVARARFPEDRKGQLTRQLATKVSDSVWHKQLSEPAAQDGRGEPVLDGAVPELQDDVSVSRRQLRAGRRGDRALLHRRLPHGHPRHPASAEELAHTFAAFEAAHGSRCA